MSDDKRDLGSLLGLLGKMNDAQLWAVARMLELSQTPNTTPEGVRAGLLLGFEIAERAATRRGLVAFALELAESGKQLAEQIEKHGLPGGTQEGSSRS